MRETEASSPRYRGLDTWGDDAILEAFWEGQARAIAAVRPALPAIAAAAREIAARIEPGGRLVYAGAGSAGRQAALDGMELGSTFSWPDARVALVLAEGPRLAPGAARGGFEDDAQNARAQIRALALKHADVAIAIAASGTTPFALAAAEAANEAGALVVAIANNAGAPLFSHARHSILLESGPEAIAGSTRMSAGTAQKAALGLLSSLVMTRLGHVHDGQMVSMRADCAKLRDRAVRIVAEIAALTAAEAAEALQGSGGGIKKAVLMARGAAAGEADRLLAETAGNLRSALGRLGTSGADA
jgi:N-acetylmuramic acid 6-phosphate etherase